MPERAWSGHVVILVGINHISETAEATVTKFCMQVEYIKCLAFDDRLLPNDRGQGHVTHLLNFAPIISFRNGEAIHFKFRVLIDTYECTSYITPENDVSCDFLKFWEISDNTSLTVQDRDVVVCFYFFVID